MNTHFDQTNTHNTFLAGYLFRLHLYTTKVIAFVVLVIRYVINEAAFSQAQCKDREATLKVVGLTSESKWWS